MALYEYTYVLAVGAGVRPYEQAMQQGMQACRANSAQVTGRAVLGTFTVRSLRNTGTYNMQMTLKIL